MAVKKLLKGDKVIILAGKDRNKTGVIEKVIPDRDRVVVGGVNVVKKHLKRSTDNPQGGIIDKTLSIHASNVMLLDPKTDKPTRVGFKNSSQDKQRFAKRSGENLKRGGK